jgi:Asp-tRNA(Asn)/Glu-tRNA(Gln) amidotransferase A subunit family amidase
MHDEGRALFAKALEDFKKAGAVLIDPIDTGLGLAESQSLANAPSAERVDAINKYLADLPPTAPIRTVEEMIAKGGDLVKPAIVEAAKIGSLDHHKPLFAAMKHQVVMREALVGLMEKYQLDAIILPYRTALADAASRTPNPPNAAGARSESRNAIASYTGLPTIVVPGGFFPSDGMPFAVQFLGKPFTEPTLIKLASGFEATTNHRKAPVTTPALPGETISF